MPKVAYSEAEKAQVREALLTKGLELLAKQGIQHTTVEQIYKAVGISRTFFYSFFPTKESLIIEALYLQQPRVLVYAQKLMDAPSLSWREAVTQFLYACCYGEKQQMLFRRLSHEAYRAFREKQIRLFGNILECFGIGADCARVGLFTNISLMAMIVRRAIPETMPLFVPEAADETVAFQIKAIVDFLEPLKKENFCR